MRIELDDVQTLALTSCRSLAERARTDALELDKQVEQLLVEARRLKAQAKEVRQHAADSMRRCWATIASCHGAEIPDYAQADMSGDRVVITWDTADPTFGSGEAGVTQAQASASPMYEDEAVSAS